MATVRKPQFGVRFYFMEGGTTVTWYDNEEARDHALRREIQMNERTREYKIIKPVERS